MSIIYEKENTSRGVGIYGDHRSERGEGINPQTITGTGTPDGISEVEVWRQIPAYEGIYEASRHGSIRSVERQQSYSRRIHGKLVFINQTIAGKVKLGGVNSSGYIVMILRKNDIPQTWQAHRLIALTFLPNPLQHRCVNHIDGNKTNNAVTNLEWCNHSHNAKHAIRTGLKKAGNGLVGVQCRNAKLTSEQVREIRASYKKESRFKTNSRELTDRYGISTQCLCNIINRKSWNHIP